MCESADSRDRIPFALYTRLGYPTHLRALHVLEHGICAPHLFRMIQGNPTATAAFQQEVEASYTRLRDRCAVLAAEGKLDKMAKSSTASSPDHIDEDNSNLTAEQAAAFRTFPKQFQEALMENDMELINAAFDAMGKEEAERVMKQCQDTGYGG